MLLLISRQRFANVILFAATGLLLYCPGEAREPFFVETTLYQAGDGGYHTFRIPALLTTTDGTLLAFAEGRKDSRADSGNIDVVVRRSRDKGKTWSTIQVVANHGEDTIGNPTAVLERSTGTILLLMTGNPGRMQEAQLMNSDPGKSRTVWITSSRDNGATWAPSREITAEVKKPEWAWYATGPGNGIQLRDGRIVIPCTHTLKGSQTMYAHVIYSEDRGATWHLGGVTEGDADESTVYERRDGSLVLNVRSDHNRHGISMKHRAISFSRDRGLSWSPFTWDSTLIEPVCQASVIRLDQASGIVLFSNPADLIRRVRMTVRLSFDEEETWAYSRVLYEGPSSYSSLAVTGDQTVACLYERGVHSFRETLTLATFNLAWLKETPGNHPASPAIASPAKISMSELHPKLK